MLLQALILHVDYRLILNEADAYGENLSMETKCGLFCWVCLAFSMGIVYSTPSVFYMLCMIHVPFVVPSKLILRLVILYKKCWAHNVLLVVNFSDLHWFQLSGSQAIALIDDSAEISYRTFCTFMWALWNSEVYLQKH